MATYRDAAVNLMKQLVGEGRSYYLGGGHEWTNLVTRNVLGVNVSVPSGGMDCSGSTSAVYKALGVLPRNSTVYPTATMAGQLCATGNFIYHDWSDSYTMRPGDLMLKPNYHVAMCISDAFDMADFVPGTGGRTKGFEDMGWTICLELSDSVGGRTWSNTSGGGSAGAGDPRYTWSQHNVTGQLELARDRRRLYGWDSAAADGICGVDTQADIIAVWQQSLNDDYPNPPFLAVDGWLGAETRMCVDCHPIFAGVSGNQALMGKYALWFNGHNVDLSNWDFTDADQAAVRAHARFYSGIRKDGVIDGAVLATLLPLAVR